MPGTGPLNIEQIKGRLADASNHVLLEVELPLGLNAGALHIKGLEENPLTRAKIELGRQLFFDGRLSKDGRLAVRAVTIPSTVTCPHAVRCRSRRPSESDA
jgi:cytochrome c peroxidase